MQFTKVYIHIRHLYVSLAPENSCLECPPTKSSYPYKDNSHPHKNVRFDTKMHGSEQKCMVLRNLFWFDPKCPIQPPHPTTTPPLHPAPYWNDFPFSVNISHWRTPNKWNPDYMDIRIYLLVFWNIKIDLFCSWKSWCPYISLILWIHLVF